MNLLDWLLVVLVLAYALAGYWQGFITGAFATAGLLLGGLFGIWLAPLALGDADPSLWVSLGALFIVILSASLGQALFQFAGAKLRDKITWQPVRAVDAVGGARCSAVAVLLVAWALGVAISGSRIGADHPAGARLAGARQGQRGAAGSAPAGAPGLQRRGRHQLLPALPRAVRAASGSSTSARRRSGIVRRPRRGRAAEASVLKIHGNNDCGRGVEGTGFLYRRRPADDQRPRGRRGRRPRGAGRRRRRSTPGSSTTTPTSTSPCSPSTASTARTCGFDLDARSPATAARSSATRRTVRTTSSRRGSAPSSGSGRPTSTATARSSARCSRCAARSGPATPVGRWCPRRARSPGSCSRRRSPTPTPATR